MGPDWILLKAFLVGLVLSIPVGPMALLSIQRTLHFGFMSGLTTGLGIALADSLYGLVGILGLSVVSDFLFKYETVLRISGGIFLGFIGMRLILESHDLKKTGRAPKHSGYLAEMASAFFLTLSNPMTILAYIAVMASMQIDASKVEHPWIFVWPVFLGSFSWWSFLNTMAFLFKAKLSEKHMHRVSMISGVLLMIFALLVIISAL